MTDQEKEELEERLGQINNKAMACFFVLKKKENDDTLSKEEKDECFLLTIDLWLDLEEERFAIKDKLKQASDSSES